jgi:hypothetical protein
VRLGVSGPKHPVPYPGSSWGYFHASESLWTVVGTIVGPLAGPLYGRRASQDLTHHRRNEDGACLREKNGSTLNVIARHGTRVMVRWAGPSASESRTGSSSLAKQAQKSAIAPRPAIPISQAFLITYFTTNFTPKHEMSSSRYGNRDSHDPRVSQWKPDEPGQTSTSARGRLLREEAPSLSLRRPCCRQRQRAVLKLREARRGRVWIAPHTARTMV